ncbi:MAG: hypothetical protein ACF8XB_07755 [Planctomycetota bacterium JB042]
MSANTLTAILPKQMTGVVERFRKALVMPLLASKDFRPLLAQKWQALTIKLPSATTTQDVAPSNVSPNAAGRTPATMQFPLSIWRQSTPFNLQDDEGQFVDGGSFINDELGAGVDALSQYFNEKAWDEYHRTYGIFGVNWADGTVPNDPFTSHTTPSIFSAEDWGPQVAKLLDEQLAPEEGRFLVMSHQAKAKALTNGFLRDVDKTGESFGIVKGMLGEKFGLEMIADHDVPTHTAGTISDGAVAFTVSAASAGATTIELTSAGATKVIQFGDIIKIAGDEQTYVCLSGTKADPFSDPPVAASGTSITSGGVSVTISPPLQVATSGGETIEVARSHKVNLGFTRHWEAVAMRLLNPETTGGDLQIPVVDEKTGLVMRLNRIRQYMQTMWTADIFGGVQYYRTNCAVRMAGKIA